MDSCSVAALINLPTTEAVFEALGGVKGVAALTGSKYKAAANWKTFAEFPSRTYVVLIAALHERGFTAPPSLWRMVPQASEAAE